jgi:hypothetical protein
MRNQRHDADEHVTRCVGSHQQVAGTLSGWKQFAPRDQHANGYCSDKHHDCIVIGITRRIARRRLSDTTLPEKDSRKRGLSTRTFAARQRPGDDRRSTE